MKGFVLVIHECFILLPSEINPHTNALLIIDHHIDFLYMKRITIRIFFDVGSITIVPAFGLYFSSNM